MAKPEVALFDPDRTYIDRFVGYCSARKNISFEIIGFSDPAALKKYLSEKKPALLLFFEESADAFKVNNFLKEEDEKIYIDKYQSAERIMSKIKTLLPIEASVQRATGEGNEGFLGVYSPLGGERHIYFSLSLAKEYALKKSVLYINLDRFPGLFEMYTKPEEGLSELIMHRRRGREEFEKNFAAAIGHINQFDILTGPANMEDMGELSFPEWEGLFKDIKRLGGYEILILDFSEAFREIDRVFDICKEIYIPVGGGRLESAALREMKEYFKNLGKEELLLKIADALRRS